jgi:hypothetical protein
LGKDNEAEGALTKLIDYFIDVFNFRELQNVALNGDLPSEEVTLYLCQESNRSNNSAPVRPRVYGRRIIDDDRQVAMFVRVPLGSPDSDWSTVLRNCLLALALQSEAIIIFLISSETRVAMFSRAYSP